MRPAVLLVLAACRFEFDPVGAGGTIDSGSVVDVVPTGTPIMVSTTGEGTGDIVITGATATCTTEPCLAYAEPGTTIHVRAVAGDGSWFRGWGIGCVGRRECDLVVPDVAFALEADFTPQPNRIFVSSTGIDGDLLVAGSGDAHCQTLATNAGLSGTYRVLVSTATQTWTTRAPGARGWIRLDDQPVVDNLSDLAFANLYAGITLDEHGDQIPLNTDVWAIHHNTGGNPFCNDWTSAASGVNGLVVDSIRGSNYGQGGGPRACDTLARVVCAQVDLDVPVQPVLDPGRKLFTTVGTFSDSSGLAAADALCASEAAALTGTFRALIAMPGVSPISRFDTSKGPWVRTDGMPVLGTGEAWSTATLVDAPFNRGAAGTAIQYNPIAFGVNDVTTPGTVMSTCDGWTSAAGTSGPILLAWDTRIRFMQSGFGGCGVATYRLLCLEE